MKIYLPNGKNVTLTQIQEAVNLNVLPLQHGYWKLRNTPMEVYYDCSVCGCEKPVTEYDMTFCPFCGAVMDDE